MSECTGMTSWQISSSPRRFLVGASTATALGSLGVARSPRPRRRCRIPAPAFYRFKVGTIEGTVVSDGPIALGDPTEDFPRRPGRSPPADDRAFLAGRPPRPRSERARHQYRRQAHPVRNRHGIGEAQQPDGPSHAKPEGGRNRSQEYRLRRSDPCPYRPHRRHLCCRRQPQLPQRADPYLADRLRLWTDDKRMGTPAEGSSLAAKKNLLPNRDRIVFYQDGKEVVPGVLAKHTPGHTRGTHQFRDHVGQRHAVPGR